MRQSPTRRTPRLMGPDTALQWRLMAGGIAVLLAEVVFRVPEPWPLKVTIDSLVTALGRHVGSVSAMVSSLVGLGIALLTIVAGQTVCNYLATVALVLVGSHTAASPRSRAFHHVQDLSRRFHARNRGADTVQWLIADVNYVQEVAITAGLPMAANTLIPLVMVVVMVFLDPLLAIIVFPAVVAFLLASSDNLWRISTASLRSCKSEGNLASTAQEALGAIKVVQVYGLEPLLHERLAGANSVSLSEGVCSRRIAVRLECSTDVIVGVTTAAVMVSGDTRTLDGATSLGDPVLFTTYLCITTRPLRGTVKYTGCIVRATALGERVTDLMAVKPDIVSPTDVVVLDRVHGTIHFDHVHAAYEGRSVLYGVNLTAVLGKHMALVGPSGSGKFTLVSLVVRTLDPTSGTVSLDGHSLNEFDLRLLRSQASVLYQEVMLLTGTIREDIRLGRPDASNEEVKAAARVAHAYEFITQMPGDYDTAVGERGGTLSGGQCQRIAIARALLRDPPIVILDGATVGLDPVSTSAVLETIDELVAGRTTLIVTYDPQAVIHADRVVWIQNGHTHLEGSLQNLMESSAGSRRWTNSHLADSFALAGSGLRILRSSER